MKMTTLSKFKKHVFFADCRICDNSYCTIENWNYINRLFTKQIPLKRLLRKFQYFHFSIFDMTFAEKSTKKLPFFFLFSIFQDLYEKKKLTEILYAILHSSFNFLKKNQWNKFHLLLLIFCGWYEFLKFNKSQNHSVI